MKNAIVVYQSRTGNTKALAQAIAGYVTSKGISTTVAPIAEAKPADLEAADVVLLGCWTGGLFIMLQGPDGPWKKFAANLPKLQAKKVGLFTTYKLATGSMFRRMSAAIQGKAVAPSLELRSKSKDLSDGHRAELDRFLA